MSAWPGLGYLAVGLLSFVAEAAVLRHRRTIGESLVEFWISNARQASPRTRWLYGPWTHERLNDPAVRKGAYFYAWIPIACFLPILGAAFLAAGIPRLFIG